MIPGSRHSLLFQGGRYIPNASKFDGTNDVLEKATDFTGSADGPYGLAYILVRFDDVTTAQTILTNNGRTFEVWIGADSKLHVHTQDAAGTSIYQFKSTSSFSLRSMFYRLLVMWQTTAAAGARLSQIYIDDVADTTVIETDTGGAGFSIDYTQGYWAVGGYGTASRANAALSEIYLNIATNLDFTNQSNRRKFIDSNANSISLGANGELPTGSSPILYLKDPYTSYGTNYGTGGNLTITGALAADAFV